MSNPSSLQVLAQAALSRHQPRIPSPPCVGAVLLRGLETHETHETMDRYKFRAPTPSRTSRQFRDVFGGFLLTHSTRHQVPAPMVCDCVNDVGADCVHKFLHVAVLR